MSGKTTDHTHDLMLGHLTVNPSPSNVFTEPRGNQVSDEQARSFLYHWHWNQNVSWWRHQMEALSALLALCAGNSPVSGEFPAQTPVTRNFDVFFDLSLIKRLSKYSWCCGDLRRHRAYYDVIVMLRWKNCRQWPPQKLSYWHAS